MQTLSRPVTTVSSEASPDTASSDRASSDTTEGVTEAETVSDSANGFELEPAKGEAGPLPWHVLIATWLGGVFDGMDSSIFAMVLFPALSELLHTQSHTLVGQYGSYIIALFMLGWALGAMAFGALADHIGRARTLTITILLYAICTGLCAFASNWWELGICRFLVGAGIGGEMGIGAVLLSEVWPAKTRVYAVSALATSLGVGYLLTAGLNLALGEMGWRYLFMAGIVPAFLTVYMRFKLREPEEFVRAKDIRDKASKSAGNSVIDTMVTNASACFRELFNDENRGKTLSVAAVASVAIVCWWAVIAWIPAWINQLTGELAVEQRSHAMFTKDIGMILSGLLGGVAIRYLGYRLAMAVSFVLAFALSVGMFQTVHSFGPHMLLWLVALGFFAHLPFVILWTYLPELYEAKVRSTAFGFIYNAGRYAAVLAALGSGVLIQAFAGSYAMAASTVSAVYLVGVIFTFFIPVRGQYLGAVE
jgi:MFS family permease